MMKPLVVELYCGRFGWSRGFVAEGYRAVGFDILHESYHGEVPEGCELVLQDVRTLHGSQFREASALACSPPCTEYSYMAMPWKRAKQIAKALRGEGEFPDGYTGSRTIAELNTLFDACFRIQREASEAKGRHIPMVVENVKGTQPWVRPAKAAYGSYYLWGDVARIGNRVVRDCVPVFGMEAVAAGGHSVKVASESGRRTDVGNGARFTSRDCGIEGAKGVTAAWFNDHKRNGTAIAEGDRLSYTSSRSSVRKAASAMIAEIPLDLARHIARVFKP